MKFEEPFEITDSKMQAAVDELQQLILARFPSTVFTVGEAEEPGGVYMRAIVDVDDTDKVTTVILDRLTDFQVDDHLPLHLVTVPTPERIATAREREKQSRRIPVLPY